MRAWVRGPAAGRRARCAGGGLPGAGGGDLAVPARPGRQGRGCRRRLRRAAAEPAAGVPPDPAQRPRLCCRGGGCRHEERGRIVLIWVPTLPVADMLAGLDGATVEVAAPDGAGLPASAADVEFYVPPFFPEPPALAAMAAMPRLRVVQTLTAGFDRVRPHVPAGAVLCNARGAHDASTAEWT